MSCGCGLGRGARDREFFSTRSNPAEDPTLIAYRAMLDVPRELVYELAKLLRAERRARGTRKGTRLLTCFRQALLVLRVHLDPGGAARQPADRAATAASGGRSGGHTAQISGAQATN